jgi:hypothetical protein
MLGTYKLSKFARWRFMTARANVTQLFHDCFIFNVYTSITFKWLLCFTTLICTTDSFAQVPPSLPSSQELAEEIITNPQVILATTHLSGIADNATARQNLMDVAVGREAQRSNYQDGDLQAPGGTTLLSAQMLWGLQRISDTFKVHVSEIAGGAHSQNSLHYQGVAFDINRINDVRIRDAITDSLTLRQECRNLGATQVLGPGDPGHNNHVHCAW